MSVIVLNKRHKHLCEPHIHFNMIKRLPNLNISQSKIVDAVRSGNNVRSDSSAGSGKSTVGYHVAVELQKMQKNVLLIVYNKIMKEETRNVAKACRLDNLQAHTYHSAAKHFYGIRGHDDAALSKLLKSSKAPKQPIMIDLLICDELQDMTPMFFEFARKLLKDNSNTNPQIVCLGDKYQCVYAHRGSDNRFLTMAPRIFEGLSKRPWVDADLTLSERVPANIVKVINTDFLGYNRMSAANPNGQVVYMRLNAWNDVKHIGELVLEAIDKYSVDDVLILQYSYDSARSPAKSLENFLVSKGIPCDTPCRDDENKPDDVLRGKVAFSTFHSCKGITRKVVFVYNVDDGYFKYFAKDAPRNICPNPMYVALTRASKRLVMIHHNTNGFFPTILQDSIRHRTKFIDLGDRTGFEIQSQFELKLEITKLIRHLPFEIIDRCMSLVTVSTIVEAEDDIGIPGTVQADDLQDSVNDINGIVLPAMFEIKQRGRCSLIEQMQGSSGVRNTDAQFVDECAKVLRRDRRLNIMDVTRLAVIYCSIRQGVKSRLVRMNTFDWLTEEHCLKAVERMEDHISKNSKCELIIDTSIAGAQITGVADVVDYDNRTLYEIKTKTEISHEDVLQLALYRLCHDQPEYSYVIFNIRNGEMKRLTASRQDLIKLAQILIEAKLTKPRLPDDAFLRSVDELVSIQSPECTQEAPLKRTKTIAQMSMHHFIKNKSFCEV